MTHDGRWKLDGRPVPPFVLGKRELKITHYESGAPWDYPVSLRILPRKDIAIVTAVDRRRTTDGGPAYKKFMCYSSADRQIVTAYLACSFSGKVKVEAWQPEKKSLLENIDFEHVDITQDVKQDRDNNTKLVARHLERIAGRETITDGLRELAEKCYFDMLWNVPESYGIYGGDVPEIPENWRQEIAAT
ncbi:hypothetical protein FJZ19_01460 [Candidatus Pacearchaeota archaeon]|nr:hypothetical protein [Candidatus Pacearchaeota archaeon]